MKIEWTPVAEGHLSEALEASTAYGPESVHRMLALISSAIERLADHPHSARPGRAEGTREVVLRRVPYILVYRVTGETLTILALRHTSRDWPRAFPEAQ